MRRIRGSKPAIRMIRSWTWNAITNLLISLVGVLVGVVFVLLRADIKNLRAAFNGVPVRYGPKVRRGTSHAEAARRAVGKT